MRSFYSSNHAPYYIFALDYIQQSAGIRALHYLCHALNESGFEAYITCEGTVPYLRTPVLSESTIQNHHITGRNPIMVYPEIVSGDPFASGGIVARWLLNKPGLIGGDTTFKDTDLIFTYTPNYLPSGWQSDILHIPTCDLSIFNNDNNPLDDSRDLVCYYAHKFLADGGELTNHIQNATSLCKNQILSHAEIASILRRSKYLYVYEPSALIVEALLCGCPVSIIETDYWRKNVSNFSCGENTGVIMNDDPESIARAKFNLKKYRPQYENTVVTDAWIQLDNFINVTQNAAASLERSRSK